VNGVPIAHRYCAGKFAGIGMAELHFSSTSDYRRAAKSGILAAQSPYRSLLCRTIMANPGGGMLILFLEISRKKRGKRKIQQNILQFSCTVGTLMPVRRPETEVRYRLKGVKNETVQSM
jgi:hypothetical protein